MYIAVCHSQITYIVITNCAQPWTNNFWCQIYLKCDVAFCLNKLSSSICWSNSLFQLFQGHTANLDQTWHTAFLGVEFTSLFKYFHQFKISSMYFCYFIIFSLWKRAWSFFGRKLNPLHPRMHCFKFGCYWPSGSGHQKIFINFSQSLFAIS